MSHPVPIFGTQNVEDDDAAVIDSYLIETDSPPDMQPATQPIPPTPDEGVPETTRMITFETVYQPGWTDPQLLLPADPNRTQFHIRVISPSSSTTDSIRLGYEKNQARTGGRVMAGQTTGAIDGHTGAVWIWAESITSTPGNSVPIGAVLNIEVWAVTK